MTETTKKPRRKVFRTLLVTAVVMALAVAVAMGANAATNGELYEATFGKWIGSATLSDGSVARFYQGTDENGIGMLTIVDEREITGEGAKSETSGSGEFATEDTFTVETDGEDVVIYDSDGNVVSTPEE